MAEVSKKRA
jgi:hypothetical protein